MKRAVMFALAMIIISPIDSSLTVSADELESKKAGGISYAETEAGRALQSLTKAYNQMDRQALEAFVNKWYLTPDSTNTLFWMELQSQYGSLEPREVWTDSPNFFEAWFYAPKLRNWCAIGLKVSAETGKISASAIARGDRAESEPASDISAAELNKHITKYLDDVCSDSLFSGVIGIYRAGKPIIELACGYQNRAAASLIKSKSRFNTASVTKPFTSTAIGVLVQQGKLSFSDPIGKYLPELPKQIGESVTIHHLLTHTSGIELDHIAEFMAQLRKVKSLDELYKVQLEFIETLLDSSGSFAPLAKHDYSNEGFDLAGVIIERISKQPYFEFLKEHVLAPSGIDVNENQLRGKSEDVAVGYTHYKTVESEFNPDSFFTNAAFSGETPLPSGSIYFTADELQQFIRAFYKQEIVNQNVRNQLISPHSRQNSSRKYGYGFELNYKDRNDASPETIGHVGGVRGGSSVLAYWPASDLCVVVLSNERFRAHAVANYLSYLISSL